MDLTSNKSVAVETPEVVESSEPLCKKPRLEENPKDEESGTGCGDAPSLDAPAAAESLESNSESEKSESLPLADLPSECEKSTAVKETDVGISEYVSHHEGFSAIIKQRYSDFIVNEINLSGEIVHLTSTGPPAEDRGKDETEELSQDNIFSKDIREQLASLVDSKDSSASVLIDAPEAKEDRTKVHKALKLHFSGLDSLTFDDNGTKKIKVFHKKAGGGRRGFGHRWPSDRGDYCRCVLYKENKDTMEAINLISKLSGLKASFFQYAGTKDRRSKSSQEITVYRVEADCLREVNVKLRNMAMGNFRYVKEALKLGQLKGNHFTIVLRNVTGKDEVIEQSLAWLQDKGFINYYGMQRFGTTAIPTHHVGRALLHGDWKTAVELILKPREDGREAEEFRKLWWETRDAKAALGKAPVYCHIERTLLQQLGKHGAKAFSTALQAMPRNTRLMYVHSYQSFVWNSMTSKRLAEHGLAVVEGDLVLPLDSDGETDTAGRVVPTVVGADDVDKFSIHDVVLPLPGFDVIYPRNAVESWYQSLLQTDGLTTSSFKQQNKDYSLPGAYRRLMVKPSNMSWKVQPYDDYTLPLVLSDLDRLNGAVEPTPLKEGKMKAISVEMSLPSSSYATMALRELLRVDTSSGHQTTLNVT